MAAETGQLAGDSHSGATRYPHTPVSMALMGMLGKAWQIPGYCASVAPPPCLRACMPRAPSEPSPREDYADRATALLFRERGEKNITGMMQSAWVGLSRECGHRSLSAWYLRYIT